MFDFWHGYPEQWMALAILTTIICYALYGAWRTK